MAGSLEVSVVLPAYNEAGTLEETVEQTVAELEEFLAPGTFEVLIAEDGCTDDTPSIAARLAESDDRIQHIHSTTRLGRGLALERAFREANGEVLVYFDTDLATDLDHLEELVSRIQSGADVATGSRWIEGHEADRPRKRGIPSRVYNQLVRVLLRSAVRDHQCGFKAFDREALFELLPDIRDDHWFWDTEILVRAQRRGYEVAEFPVDWTAQGDTKVDLVRDILGMGSAILRTWWALTVRPRITRGRSIAAGILLTILAVLLMTQYLDFGAVVNAMQAADLRLVAAATGVYILSWPLRGTRYRDILTSLTYPESAAFLTGAVFISQTGNLVFPARAGDAVRAYIVKTRRGVPYPTGFASLAIERVFDLLTITAMAGMVLVGLLILGDPSFIPQTEETAIIRSGRTALMVAGVVGIAAIGVVVLIILSARSERNRVRTMVARVSDDSYAHDVAAVLERFVGDIQTVAATPRTFAQVGFASILIWSLDVITAALVLSAFESVALAPIALLAVCFFAVSVGNLAKVLPLSPGGIGLYEGAFTILVVGLAPISVAVALGAAIVDHAVKNIVTMVGGVASMLILNVSLTTAAKHGSAADEIDEDEEDLSSIDPRSPSMTADDNGFD